VSAGISGSGTGQVMRNERLLDEDWKCCRWTASMAIARAARWSFYLVSPLTAAMWTVGPLVRKPKIPTDVPAFLNEG
jgi:hypothetical protein